MHPILFEIGKIKIHSYGVMVALGFLVAIYLASREARRNGVPPQKIFDIGLYALLFGIAGARILHVLLDFRYYAGHPLEIIMINRGGLSIHGGLLAGIAAAYLFIKLNRIPLWKTADIIIPYLALAQAIGRMGCYLNGCCYGTPTYLPFGISLPGHILRLHPIQLYLALFLFLTFIALKIIYKRKKYDGEAFFSYFLIFSFGRFFIDFLRGDLNPVFLGLRMSQIFSAGIFLIALALFMAKRARMID
jgi:prolipoprotein diacylglyceryl transferase